MGTIRQRVASVFVTFLVVGAIFLLPELGRAASVSIEGLPNGATLDRLSPRAFQVQATFPLGNGESITGVKLRITNLDAPLFGAPFSIAEIRTDGQVLVGEPPVIEPEAFCSLSFGSPFGYGYGYGYGYNAPSYGTETGPIGFGYGYGAGYGYGQGYGANIILTCHFALATPLFDLGVLDGHFTLQASVHTSEDNVFTSPARSFVVYDAIPSAKLTPLAQGAVGAFSATFTVDATDADRPVSESSWLLDWGDGTTPSPVLSGSLLEGASTHLLTHNYLGPGPYTAVLRVTDADGGVGIEQAVVGIPPSVRLIPVDVRGDSPLTVDWELTVEDLAAAPGGWNIQRWALNFGDGDSIEGSGADLGPDHQIVVPHEYQVAGTYTAVATALDVTGLSGTDSATAIVDTTEQCLPTIKFHELDGGSVVRYNPDGGYTPATSAAARLEIVHQGLQCDFLNNAPHLVGGWADKTVGGTTDSFVFRVTYFDFDGDAPTAIDVQVDAGPIVPLALETGTAHNAGVVYKSAPISGLVVGVHDFTFHATDGALEATPLVINDGFEVRTNTIVDSVLVANPANRFALAALAPGAPSEILPPLSIASGAANGIDSFTFALPATASPGVAYTLSDLQATAGNDWDLCFYARQPAAPTNLAPVACDANAGAETGTIPATATHANVWGHAGLLLSGSFQFAWDIKVLGTAPTVVAPADTGLGVAKVWLDDGDNVIDGTETAAAVRANLPSHITPILWDVSLPMAADGRFRFAAEFTNGLGAHPNLLRTRGTDAVVLQRFVNDVPAADITVSDASPVAGVAITFNLASTDADDSQGTTPKRLGGLQAWTFDAGDGTTITNPAGPIAPNHVLTHTYASLGSKMARLTVRDQQGVERTDFVIINVRANQIVHTVTVTPNLADFAGPSSTSTTSPTTPSSVPITTTSRPSAPRPSVPAVDPTPAPSTTPSSVTSPTPAPTSAPTEPNLFAQNVLAVPQADGSIRVTWQAPADAGGEIAGWFIWRASSPFTLIARIDDPNQRSFSDTTVEPGKQYNYVVTLFLATGEGVVDALDDVTGFVTVEGLPSSGYQTAGVLGRGLSTGSPTSGFLTSLLLVVAILIVAALIAVALAMRSGPRTGTVVMPTGTVLVAPKPTPQDGLARVIERVNEEGTSESFLLLHCTRCDANFETLYSEERPLIRNCGNCGRLGILPPLRESVGPPRGPTLAKLGGPDADEISRLQAWGITTSEQLRNANVDEVASLTHIPTDRLNEWRARAELVRIRGISSEAAALLVGAGIRSPPELSTLDPKTVAERVREKSPEAGVEKRRVEAWIEAARTNQLDKWADPAAA